MVTKENIKDWLSLNIDRPRNFESRAQAIDNIEVGTIGLTKYSISKIYGKLGNQSLEEWAKKGLDKLVEWMYKHQSALNLQSYMVKKL